MIYGSERFRGLHEDYGKPSRFSRELQRGFKAGLIEVSGNFNEKDSEEFLGISRTLKTWWFKMRLKSFQCVSRGFRGLYET